MDNHIAENMQKEMETATWPFKVEALSQVKSDHSRVWGLQFRV